MSIAAESFANRERARLQEPEVDPRIAAIIEQASAPVATPPMTAPPRGMPGRTGVVAGLGAVFSLLRRGVGFSLDAREEFGDVFRTSFAGADMVICWDADLIQEILKNEQQIWSAAIGWDVLSFKGLDPRAANTGTLLSLDFEEHRRARKLVQPAFTLAAIEGYLETAGRAFDAAITEWLARGVIDFKTEVRKLLANVAHDIFLGIRDHEQVEVIDRALFDAWNVMMAVSRNPWISPTFRKARRGFKTLLETFLALVPERRRSDAGDLFTRMCNGSDPNEFSDEALVRVFVTIMFGAFDTTSAAVTSMAYLLAKHDACQTRTREEALGVSVLDAATMRNLRQLDWAWKETLRLMPVTSFVPRCALRDTELAGHRIAAGTFVGPMSGAIGRHPKWWTNPRSFDPERFSPERAEDKKHPSIYQPFGAGVHSCVGMQLANMEAKLLFHKLLTRCRFELAPDYEAAHTNTPLGCVSGKVTLRLTALS